MRHIWLVVPLAILACAKQPTPEELAKKTADDLDTFWQEAVATARVTNTMSSRDELFSDIEGMQRYPSTTRPTIPDSSSTNEAFDDLRVLTKRVFTEANVIDKGGSQITFRVTGTDLCTPLRGSFNASTSCVKNVDSLKIALRAVGGTNGIDVTLLFNDKIEIGTAEILTGSSVSVAVDLANAKAASEFVNSTLGQDSPFRDLTFDGSGKLEVKLKKWATSDFEATISFLSDLKGTVTDNNGFTRSGSAAAKSPAVALRVNGTEKSVSGTIDFGASDFHGMWSDFFDYKLKDAMVWTLSGLTVKAKVKDGDARTATFALGSSANTLSFGGQNVVSVTLNPGAKNGFDVVLSTGNSGLSAATVSPGITFALNFNLQAVKNAGSQIDDALLNSLYTYELSAGDSAPKFELNKISKTIDASWQLTNGTLSLTGSNNGNPRSFTGPQCIAFRQNRSSQMSAFLDFWMRCEECVGGACGGSVDQSPECSKYVRCYEATGGTAGSLDSSYGQFGNCWTAGQSTASACTSTCTSALASLKTAYPSVFACQ
jgi:hypothetical protein